MAGEVDDDGARRRLTRFVAWALPASVSAARRGVRDLGLDEPRWERAAEPRRCGLHQRMRSALRAARELQSATYGGDPSRAGRGGDGRPLAGVDHREIRCMNSPGFRDRVPAGRWQERQRPESSRSTFCGRRGSGQLLTEWPDRAFDPRGRARHEAWEESARAGDGRPADARPTPGRGGRDPAPVSKGGAVLVCVASRIGEKRTSSMRKRASLWWAWRKPSIAPALSEAMNSFGEASASHTHRGHPDAAAQSDACPPEQVRLPIPHGA